MATLTDRITCYLLRRIRRLAVIDLYENAAKAGLLEVHFVDGEARNGLSWRLTEMGADLLTGDPARAHAIIGRRLRRSKPPVSWQDLLNTAGNETRERVRSMPKDHVQRDRLATLDDRDTRHEAAMLSLLRQFLPKPNIAQVAVSLLLARALGENAAAPDHLRSLFRRPDLYVLIKVPVPRFERHFGRMLEDGLIAPWWATLSDLLGGEAISQHYRESRPGKARRKIATLSTRSIPDATMEALRRNIGKTLLGDHMPMVIVDETGGVVTPQIKDTADLVLECAGFDHKLLAELLRICCGMPPVRSLRLMEQTGFDAGGLGIDDLALAVRPGRSLEDILTVLAMLANGSHGDDADGDQDKADGAGKKTSGKTKPVPSAAVEIIRPTADPEVTPVETVGEGTGRSSPPAANSLRVEALAGYGDATRWALELKADLALWREGIIAWDQMSTKLLLSGPPGTGKTTFARALCNTLQVPLIVSSVTSWLEPGYLGDVLKSMSAVFATARSKAPCILFIDEIDGIGSRNGARHSRDHADYWTSLVNRLLELLDGALKSEGVIVVAATNQPEKIDPALLRSGRLEKHVVIPPPDVEALAGILLHHLGADLDAVLNSRPTGVTPKRLKPPQARDATPLVKRKTPEAAAHDEKGPFHD